VERLQVDQAVTLSLDDVPESIECRVLDFAGAGGRLAYREELPPSMIGALVVGSAGYVVFDQLGSPVGLRVSVRASPPHLEVAITDGVEVTERRVEERVKLWTRVGIIRPGEADRPPEWTYTIDLSEHGALLRAHAAFEEHEQFTLELMFGNDPEPITAEAEVVRRTDGAVGVKFEPASMQDATRLGGYLAGIRQQRRAATNN
jgi:hypothetical protein